MPIFDQGYQHWEGKLAGPAWRWWAIARRGCIIGLRAKFVKMTLFSAFVPALALVVLLSLWGLFEQKLTSIVAFLELFPLPDELKAEPKSYRVMIWTLAYTYFFRIEMFFGWILVSMIGQDLISQDLRFNAIPLYLSKPVRRIDYFLGKLGVIGAFVAAVMIAPAVAAYVCGMAFSLDITIVRDTWRLFAGSMIFGVIVVISAGTLMLAMSSLSKNSRIVGGMWVGFVILSINFSAVLNHITKQDWCKIVSYPNNLYCIQDKLFDTPGAWKKIVDLQQAVVEKAQAAAAGGNAARMLMQAQFGKTAPPFPPPPQPGITKQHRNRPNFNQPGSPEEWRLRQATRTKSEFEKMAEHRFPLSWAVGVFGGLFALSVFILSQRVKSLDRLK